MRRWPTESASFSGEGLLGGLGLVLVEGFLVVGVGRDFSSVGALGTKAVPPASTTEPLFPVAVPAGSGTGSWSARATPALRRRMTARSPAPPCRRDRSNDRPTIVMASFMSPFLAPFIEVSLFRATPASLGGTPFPRLPHSPGTTVEAGA